MPPKTPAAPGPPRWARLPEGFDAWLLTRYDDVRSALSDQRLTRDRQRAADARAAAGLPFHSRGSSLRGTTLLECDPPKHSELRKAVNQEFAARRVLRIRPRLADIAQILTDEFCEAGVADLAAQFALPFTAYSLCEFIGLPVQDWEKFHGWVRDVHQADPTPEGGRRVAEATSALQTYTEAVVAAKRDRQDAAASDDVLTRLATTDRTGGLGDDDLVAMGRSLLVGGYESTKSLISTGMLGLLTHPEQMESLRADPGGIASAVDEFLRYEPPFPRLQERYALQDVEIGGVTIPRGQPVVIDLTAANRDPDRFRRPSAFDVADADRGHVSFGPGIHHCLGATLAKAETEVAVEVLLQRLPEITLDCDPATLHWPDGIVSGPSTLPVRFAPSAPVAARR